MSVEHERALALLERRRELEAGGREVSAAELCADAPELLPEVERLLAFVRSVERQDVPEVAGTAGRTFHAADTVPAADAEGPSTAVLGPRPVVPHHDILGLLGEGGMGAVYRARDRRLGRVVALKVIREGIVGAGALARFQAEAEAVARLNHPNVVQVYEVGRWQPAVGGPLPYLSLEYVPGGTLEGRVGKEPVAPHEAARLVRLLARAVQALHRAGLVHRDLKPANVLLAPPADEPGLNCAWGCPKLADLGLARAVEASPGRQPGEPLTRPGTLVGTPAYMAPEQAQGPAEVGPPADVYALGAILYRLLTGRPPFQGKTPLDTLMRAASDAPVPPRQLRPEVPSWLEAVCLRCLHKDPAQRPSAEEVAALVKPPRRGEAVEDSPACRPVNGKAGAWVALGALAVVVLASGVIAGRALWRDRRSNDPDPEPVAVKPNPPPPVVVKPAPAAPSIPVGWITFAPDGGRFRVALPGQPMVQRRPINAGPVRGEQVQYIIQQGRAVYSVIYTDTAGLAFTEKDVARSAPNLRSGMIGKLTNPKVLREEVSRWGGYPGVELEVESEVTGVPCLWVARNLFAGSRVYNLMVRVPKADGLSADVPLFFRSFQINP